MKSHQISRKLNRHVWTVTGVYALIALLWILLSDYILSQMAGADQITRIQSWKGIFFVAVTTLLLFILIRRKNHSLETLFKKLRNQMQHFQDTFEQAAVGIVHISKDGQWIRVNRKICDILGYSHQEFRKLAIEDIVHPEDLEKGLELDLELLEGKRKSYVLEKRYLNKEKKTIYARLTKSGVYNYKGKLDYMVAVIEDISPQKVAERQLMKSLEQKKMLLAEIHHRVKNNLAIISGLMELQVFNTDDDLVKQVLKETMLRIKSMALIHESYYEKGELAHVNVDEYLREFVGYFKNAFQKQQYPIDIRFETDPVQLNINQAIPCGLLLNELLIKIYSRAFRDKQKCTIRIQIKSKDNTIELVVKDDLEKSIEPFDTEQKSSLDMMIIDALLKQLNSSLDLQNHPGGHTLAFHFKREDKKGSSNALINNLD